MREGYYCIAETRLRNGGVVTCNEQLVKEEKLYRCPKCNSTFSISYVEPKTYKQGGLNV